MHEGLTPSSAAGGRGDGHAAYMPPEQAQASTHEIDPHRPPRALGALMFTLITSECVHQARRHSVSSSMGDEAGAPILTGAWCPATSVRA